jgi:hypothetical protein
MERGEAKTGHFNIARVAIKTHSPLAPFFGRLAQLRRSFRKRALQLTLQDREPIHPAGVIEPDALTLAAFHGENRAARPIKDLKNDCERTPQMTISTIVLIIVILLLIGAVPTWSHSRSWGYGPSGGLGLVLLIVIILMVMGRI